MDILLRISRAIDAINAAAGRFARWMVLLCALVSAANAISRYAFSISSNAWLEIQWYMFAALVMLGAADTLARNGHVRVDLIYGNVPPRARAWIDLIGMAIFLLPATLIIGWVSWPLFLHSWAIQEMSNNAGGLVRWPVKLMLPLGFALLSLQGVSEIVKRWAVLRGDDGGGGVSYERPLQ